jgi:hypothetical protein
VLLCFEERARPEDDHKLGFANLGMQRFDSQNVNVSSSAIKMTGGPPDEIFTALARVSLAPADSAHF